MNKEIDLILKLLTIMLLLISLIVAILSFNINKLGVISINNYSLVMPKAKENKKIKTNDLFITKKIGISQIKVNDEVVYIDIEDNKSIQKIGKVKSINIEFNFDNKNNELHFNVFDNEEYVIGIFNDGFFINRVDHYTLYLSNMKSVLDFIKNNLK